MNLKPCIQHKFLRVSLVLWYILFSIIHLEHFGDEYNDDPVVCVIYSYWLDLQLQFFRGVFTLKGCAIEDFNHVFFIFGN